jgi:uncharacterized membrane protein
MMRIETSMVIVPVLALLGAAGCGDGDPYVTPAVDAAPDVDAPPPPPVGLTLSNFEIAVDVTPDGRTAVFEDISDEGQAHLVLVDTVTGEMVDQGAIGDASKVMPSGISADGKVSALHGMPVQAGVWSAAGGWVDLGSPHPAGCDIDVSGAFDISADGLSVVGLVWDGCTPDAFRWTAAGGFTILQSLGFPFEKGAGRASNRATVISDDGTVIGGFAQAGGVDRMPAIWSAADGTGFLLDGGYADAPGEILSISADGKTAAGIWGNDGFVWTRGTGVAFLRRFDLALPGDPVYPNAMTADGRTIYGGVGSGFFSIPTAFVWTAPDGMIALADVARAAGVEVPANLILNSVLGASADGRVLIGTATENDVALRTFVLRLP